MGTTRGVEGRERTNEAYRAVDGETIGPFPVQPAAASPSPWLSFACPCLPFALPCSILPRPPCCSRVDKICCDSRSPHLLRLC